MLMRRRSIIRFAGRCLARMLCTTARTRSSWSRRRCAWNTATAKMSLTWTQFVKFGLTQDALRSYVQLITAEVHDFIKRHNSFKGQKGTVDIPKVIAELTIYTASR